MKPHRIILIRHGECHANTDESKFKPQAPPLKRKQISPHPRIYCCMAYLLQSKTHCPQNNMSHHHTAM